MTSVLINKKESSILSVKVTGHAFYAKHGDDIVCAAISMICYTIGNKLFEIEDGNININIEEGLFELSIFKITKENQLLLNTLLTGFFMIEEKYSKFIKIKEVE